MRSFTVGIKQYTHTQKQLFVSLKWVKLKSKKQALNYLGGEEGNGGFNCNIPFG